MTELKKTETLFHTTKSMDNLSKIILNNFNVSYSSEIFSGFTTLIPMVSFSNVLLFETKSQINYGAYSIGLNKAWGIQNKLHPEVYNYDNSYYETSLNDLRILCENSQFLTEMNEFKNKTAFNLKTTNADFNQIMQQFIHRFDDGGQKIIMEFLN